MVRSLELANINKLYQEYLLEFLTTDFEDLVDCDVLSFAEFVEVVRIKQEGNK